MSIRACARAFARHVQEALTWISKNKEEVSIVAAGQWEYIFNHICAPTIDNYDVRSLGYVYLKHALVVIGIMWTCKMYEVLFQNFYSVKCSYHMCTCTFFRL